MSKNVRDVVNRFWASYSLCEDELSAEELSQIAEDARHALELDPPSACVEWWSALSLAVQHKWLADHKTPTMYGAWCTSRKRQEAVNFARASVGLEGFKPSEATEQEATRFIAGEIDLAEILKSV